MEDPVRYVGAILADGGKFKVVNSFKKALGSNYIVLRYIPVSILTYTYPNLCKYAAYCVALTGVTR